MRPISSLALFLLAGCALTYQPSGNEAADKVETIKKALTGGTVVKVKATKTSGRSWLISSP